MNLQEFIEKKNAVMRIAPSHLQSVEYVNHRFLMGKTFVEVKHNNELLFLYADGQKIDTINILHTIFNNEESKNNAVTLFNSECEYHTHMVGYIKANMDRLRGAARKQAECELQMHQEYLRYQELVNLNEELTYNTEK